jgi:hypothetical protein
MVGILVYHRALVDHILVATDFVIRPPSTLLFQLALLSSHRKQEHHISSVSVIPKNTAFYTKSICTVSLCTSYAVCFYVCTLLPNLHRIRPAYNSSRTTDPGSVTLAGRPQRKQISRMPVYAQMQLPQAKPPGLFTLIAGATISLLPLVSWSRLANFRAPSRFTTRRKSYLLAMEDNPSVKISTRRQRQLLYLKAQ